MVGGWPEGVSQNNQSARQLGYLVKRAPVPETLIKKSKISGPNAGG